MWFYGYLPVFARGVGLYFTVGAKRHASKEGPIIQVVCGKFIKEKVVCGKKSPKDKEKEKKGVVAWCFPRVGLVQVGTSSSSSFRFSKLINVQPPICTHIPPFR